MKRAPSAGLAVWLLVAGAGSGWCEDPEPAPVPRPLTVATADEFRRAAVTIPGDPARGRLLFADRKGTCETCHTVDDRGGKAGPDLLGVADKLDRTGLVRAVLEPSADILPGYETTVVTTKAGTSSTGILKYAGEREIELIGSDG